MKKMTRSTSKQSKNDIKDASYNLRYKATLKKTIKNVSKKAVSRKPKEIIKNTPKKVSVVSTKIRQQPTKKLINVSTSTSKQLEQKIITRSKRINDVSKIIESVSKSPVKKALPALRELSIRLEKLETNHIYNTSGQNKIKHSLDEKQIAATPENKLLTKENNNEIPTSIQNKIKSNLVEKKIRATSENKITKENNSAKPTRALRKRKNLIPNKYKDLTLDSPALKKPLVPNQLAVYEFECDSFEEPRKKKNRKNKYSYDSSGEDYEDKKLRKVNKKVAIKRRNNKIGNNKAVEQQHKVEQIQINIETKQDTIEEKQMTEKLSIMETKEDRIEEKQIPFNMETKSNQPLRTTEPPQITVEVSLSDQSNSFEPLFPVDPSIQARNIVEEVTKSFIEDLSDEESNRLSPGKVNIISNVVVRKPNNKKNKIFNSTVIGSKYSKPWRINVSAIQKRPHIFTYKDKSFTPRYEPEVVEIDGSTVNLNQTNNKDDTKIQKATHQTSILDFLNKTKPKIIETKNALFVEAAQKKLQSPRKVLGDINFLQSTPLKPNNNLNIVSSPNISFISPKNKSSDHMFGFSYISDEDKENLIRNPLKIETNEIFKRPKINIVPPEITPPQFDSDISVPLFQDYEEELELSKKCTKKYVRKQPKRKRLPSVETLLSDEDEFEEKLPGKKKFKNVRTRKEQKEADKLASHYNSMFEEIEKYPLIIE